MLTDINMPYMNGFEICKKILELDANIRVCFISSADVDIEALREAKSKKYWMFYQKTSNDKLSS